MKTIDTSDYENITAEEHAVIVARQQLASARAKASGMSRLGILDRHAMSIEDAERLLAEAQKAFDAK